MFAFGYPITVWTSFKYCPKDFEKSTYTHCEVSNFAPSISAAIGSFVPQKYIWQASIALHSAPRAAIQYSTPETPHKLPV